MTNEQIYLLAAEIARQTAKSVVEELKKSNAGVSSHVSKEPELVSTREAARILGISPTYLSQIKDRFRHVKTGDTQQSRILFYRSDLLPTYLSEL